MTQTATSTVAVARRIDDALVHFLDDRARSLGAIGGPDLEPLVQAARTCVLGGGKRLRPVLAYLGWLAACGGELDDDGIVMTAASLELLHACALVHDDVIDDSQTRRGRPSAHRSFAGLHDTQHFVGDGTHFGRSAAIMLGDLLLCWSDRMLAGAPLRPVAARAVRDAYDEMRDQVITGQYLDVLVQARGRYSVEDALRVVEYKTSKYTVEGPLLIGAAAGGAGPELTGVLREFAQPVGEAFQLRDDVLGVFGDPARTGKPAGDDLRQGKRTLLVVIAADRADAAQAAVLRRHFGRPALSSSGLTALRGVIVDTGALAEVEARIMSCTARARAVLATAQLRPEARDALDRTAVAAAMRHA